MSRDNNQRLQLSLHLSGKERDEETSFSCFTARYYNSSLSLWLSVDPLADKYPNLSPYTYCRDNPIVFVDPNGMFDIKSGTIEKGDNLTDITKQINAKYHTSLTIADIAKGNNIKDPNVIKAGDKIILPGQEVELNFDINKLKVTDKTYGVDMPGLSWEATSGREGYQSSEFQNVANKGPIPEGNYIVNPEMTQSYSETSTADKILGIVGRGSWPGGRYSWGNHRTWLTPIKGTETFGRNNFSIHGGKTPGSAGCIDLTSGNDSFHSWLSSYGKSVQLKVNYQK